VAWLPRVADERFGWRDKAAISFISNFVSFE